MSDKIVGEWGTFHGFLCIESNVGEPYGDYERMKSRLEGRSMTDGLAFLVTPGDLEKMGPDLQEHGVILIDPVCE